MEYTRERIKDASCCVGCGHKPVAIHYDYDMWYIECGNRNCTKYGKYLFLGQTKQLALEQWQKANRPINRYYQKRLRDETNDTESTDVGKRHK